MDYLDPLARQDDRIGGGHPRLFEAHGQISIAASPSPWIAADRRDEALLADFWYPDARAGAFGIRWVENSRAFCRQRRLLGQLRANLAGSGAFVLSLCTGYFSVRASWVLLRLMGAGPPAPGTPPEGAIVLRVGTGSTMPAYRALDRSGI